MTTMRFLKLLATLLSLSVAGVGILGITAPAVLVELGQTLIRPPAVYGVAAVRVLFGALLILVAGGSRMPLVLRVVGAVIVVAGFLTPFLGTERFVQALAWFSDGRLLLFRAFAVLPVAVGLFFVYAISSPASRHRR